MDKTTQDNQGQLQTSQDNSGQDWTSLDNNTLNRPARIPLSVELIAYHLSRGQSQADIARLCGCSRVAVHDYIDRHPDELEILRDQSDALLGLRYKRMAAKALGVCNTLLNNPRERDLHSSGILSGVFFDKYRLASNKSTGNLSVQDTSGAINEMIESIQAKLQATDNIE